MLTQVNLPMFETQTDRSTPAATPQQSRIAAAGVAPVYHGRRRLECHPATAAGRAARHGPAIAA
jgi:hypothetical protein